MASGCCGDTEGDFGALVLNADVSAPPFTIQVSLSGRGSVIPKTGVATIRGTTVCSEPGFVDIQGELRQKIGRMFISGFFFVEVACSTDPTSFTADTRSSNGLFVAGSATIRDVDVFGCADSGDCSSDFIPGPLAVKLRK